MISVNERIKVIYQDYAFLEHKIQYSINKARKETELLFHSPVTIVEYFDKVKFINQQLTFIHNKSTGVLWI